MAKKPGRPIPGLKVGDYSYGRFVGTVVAEFNDDGRTMTLRKAFSYIHPDLGRWRAPSGSVIDGASIPRIAWSLIGGPFEGKYRNASVLHDVACVERKRFWPDVHRMFFFAMLASGVSQVKAKIMYAAVYHFGPRWRSPLELVVDAEPERIPESKFDALRNAIEASERAGSAMTLVEIDKFGMKQEILPRALPRPAYTSPE
jgi:hypothetical protein